MPRVRLGVALLLAAPIDAEVDGLRRALDDGTLGRMPAHLTLVPPVNVREDRLGEALAVLRTAAAATRPLALTLGPPSTFLPNNPTLYLPVDGDDQEVRALRDRVFVEPLARPLTWPFVPHVTLADEASSARIDAAISVLAGYQVEVSFDRVHLLREGQGRTWTPIADASFSSPAVIGRHGLSVELTVTETSDPDVAALAAADGLLRLVVTARTGAGVVGFAEGWCRRRRSHLSALVVTSDGVGLGIGDRLLAAFRSEAAAREADHLTLGPALGEPEDLG